MVYVFFAGALIWYGLASLQTCSSEKEASQEGYVGEQVCATCHQEEYQAWKGSHHDMAMAEATEATVLGDFSDKTLESKGIASRFFKNGGKFFVNTEGPDGRNQDFEVSYTFGFFPLQQYMVKFPGGRIQCLHVAWDSRDNKWFDLQPNEKFTPDDWMHWTKGSMTWNTMCADCHSTNLHKNYDPEKDEFHTTWSIIDVSCEACHGPGRRHQEYVNSSAYHKGERVAGSYMYLTAGLTNRQQVDQCARCHSLRSQETLDYDHSGTYMDHYLPQIPRPAQYYPDGQILEEVYVYGSFLQSKMYRNNVKCTDCHNPHTLKLAATGNTLCGKCHQAEKYDTPAHHFHPVGTESALCVNCHMPGKYYMVNDFRRDHSFRVPRPDLSAKYGTPNACNRCHADQPAEWAAAAVVKWYGPGRKLHFSDVLVPALQGDRSVLPQLAAIVGDTSQPEIIQATAVWILGQEGDRETVTRALTHPDPLVRYQAVAGLDQAPDQDKLRLIPPLFSDSVRSVRAFTAYVMAGTAGRLLPERWRDQYRRVQAEYDTVLLMQADFPAGQLMRGQYFQKQGKTVEAIAAYRKSAAMDPLLAQPHFNLGNIYYQQGDFAAARAAFEGALQRDSNFVDAHYALGLLLAEVQQMEKAAYHLGEAAVLSGIPRYYYNWGLALQNLNRRREAEAVFTQGLRLDSDSEALLYALAILYLQDGKRDAAQPLVYRLLQINPQNTQYQELLRSFGPR